jgi:hypothetical protein
MSSPLPLGKPGRPAHKKRQTFCLFYTDEAGEAMVFLYKIHRNSPQGDCRLQAAEQLRFLLYPENRFFLICGAAAGGMGNLRDLTFCA